MNFFGKSKELQKLEESLNEQDRKIERYLQTIKHFKTPDMEYCTLRGKECASKGLHMWEKDLNLRYTFLNARHCTGFYGTPYEEKEKILGRTTAELTKRKKDVYAKAFNVLCLRTEAYVHKRRKKVNFWEIGYIHGVVMLVDLTKEPIFDHNGDMIGTRSWGLDMSHRECEVKIILEEYLKTGQAKRIDDLQERGAAYVIKKVKNPFKGDFPC